MSTIARRGNPIRFGRGAARTIPPWIGARPDFAWLWLFAVLFLGLGWTASSALKPIDLSLGGDSINDLVTEVFLFYGALMSVVAASTRRITPKIAFLTLLAAALLGPFKLIPELIHEAALIVGFYPHRLERLGFVNPNMGKILMVGIALIAVTGAMLRRATADRAFALIGLVGIILTTGLFHYFLLYTSTTRETNRLNHTLWRTVTEDPASFRMGCGHYGFECHIVPVDKLESELQRLDRHFARTLGPELIASAISPRPVINMAIVEHATGQMRPSGAAGLVLPDKSVRLVFDYHMYRETLLTLEWQFNGLALAAYTVWGPLLTIVLLIHRRPWRLRQERAAAGPPTA